VPKITTENRTMSVSVYDESTYLGFDFSTQQVILDQLRASVFIERYFFSAC